MKEDINKFPDYVEITAFDTLRTDPTYPTKKILDFLFFGKQAKYLCATCHDYITFKLIKNNIKGDSFTIKCKCGVHVIYPESKKRNNCRLWKFIPAEVHYANKRKKSKE